MVEHSPDVEQNTLQMVKKNTLQMVEQNTLQIVEQNTLQTVEQNTLQMVEAPYTLIQLNQCRVRTADDESVLREILRYSNKNYLFPAYCPQTNGTREWLVKRA